MILEIMITNIERTESIRDYNKHNQDCFATQLPEQSTPVKGEMARVHVL